MTLLREKAENITEIPLVNGLIPSLLPKITWPINGLILSLLPPKI